MMLIMVFL